MAIGKDKVRMQIVVTKEMAEQIDEQSKKLGISKSAMSNLLLTRGIMGIDLLVNNVKDKGSRRKL